MKQVGKLQMQCLDCTWQPVLEASAESELQAKALAAMFEHRNTFAGHTEQRIRPGSMRMELRL